MTSTNTYINIISDISHKNKYCKWYANIINNAMQRISDTESYTEKHHIVPECMFINRTRKGSIGFIEGDPNHKDNFVYLSAREHFITHVLLALMLKDKKYVYKMTISVARMGKGTNKYFNSRLYGISRKLMIKNHTNKSSENKLKISIKLKEFARSSKGIEFYNKKSEDQKITMIGKGNPMFGKESSF